MRSWVNRAYWRAARADLDAVRGCMAREPLRREVAATFRCVVEDFTFPGKRMYVAHDAGEEPGAAETHIGWAEVEPKAKCPNDSLHSIELVE
jgi:hypothetical protein